eukprot:TRINITY_DN1874_c1_g1_i1.p1 TRINITY_DN1874_c1_g1~~TRINITY_DN1874_c1_g1_i1.p1  ORF type:complete len:147 (+),score=40.56 TRINITY_DN1874_c1_g1_i1:256-696(+)
MSGIEVNAEVITPFIQRINKNSKNGPLRYVILKINDKNTEVVLDVEGAREETWTDFTNQLLQRKPCYAVFDLEYHNQKNGIDTSKLITVLWRGNASTGTAGMKEKMLIASTLKTFQQNLALQGGVFQAGNEQELDIQDVIDFANRI